MFTVAIHAGLVDTPRNYDSALNGGSGGEERTDVAGRDGGGKCALVVEDRGEKIGLALLEFHDLLLNGVLRNHAVHHDLLGLADRWVRSTAWFSVAGFHHGSRR